jgi:hypothetical protein
MAPQRLPSRLPVPTQRQPGRAGRLEREIRIRQLRNAGSVISELASTGAIGRWTSSATLRTGDLPRLGLGFTVTAPATGAQ